MTHDVSLAEELCAHLTRGTRRSRPATRGVRAVVGGTPPMLQTGIRRPKDGASRAGCGREDRHPYELFLKLEEIEHRKTKVGRSQSNRFIERCHRTLLDEHLRVKGRTTWHESVDEMQTDLDAYLETYNRHRPHRRRGMEGRTPHQVFKKGIRKPRSRKKSTRKEVKTAA